MYVHVHVITVLHDISGVLTFYIVVAGKYIQHLRCGNVYSDQHKIQSLSTGEKYMYIYVTHIVIP